MDCESGDWLVNTDFFQLQNYCGDLVKIPPYWGHQLVVMQPAQFRQAAGPSSNLHQNYTSWG